MARKDITDRMVCEAAERFHAASRVQSHGDEYVEVPNLETDLVARTGEHWKVVNAALMRADKRGLIECGVSLRTSWLTDKGKFLLQEWRALDRATYEKGLIAAHMLMSEKLWSSKELPSCLTEDWAKEVDIVFAPVKK